MLTVSLCDANLSGSIEFPIDDLADLQNILNRAGVWQELPSTTGAVLLSDPYGYVYDGAYVIGESTPTYAFQVIGDTVKIGLHDTWDWDAR